MPRRAWRGTGADLPAWRGHLEALGRYALTCCEVWVEAGRADTCAVTVTADLAAAGVVATRTQDELAAAGALPYWIGDDDVHRSHRSSLVRKDPDFYGPLFPDVPTDLDYVWPAPHEDPRS